MDETTAYCGLICENCPIYIATRIEDPDERAAKRIDIARICVEEYSMNYTPEEITDCDGCKTDGGRLFVECAGCVIRKCARARNLDNCAFCEEYVCERLESFFESDPPSRERLEVIRRQIG